MAVAGARKVARGEDEGGRGRKRSVEGKEGRNEHEGIGMAGHATMTCWAVEECKIK